MTPMTPITHNVILDYEGVKIYQVLPRGNTQSKLHFFSFIRTNFIRTVSLGFRSIGSANSRTSEVTNHWLVVNETALSEKHFKRINRGRVCEKIEILAILE